MGVSQQEVAERLEVTQGAVSLWVARAREGGDEALKSRPRSGRPPGLSPDLVPRVLAALEEGTGPRWVWL
ncbi:helix-turn-helix domain-containing protein [Litchfieldella anticariensis]|uniref:helix-turn-helix domain-containing protein n=1 Tax=Litchfieldella anticariensis TaxID=258591 RepID=UPI0004178B90